MGIIVTQETQQSSKTFSYRQKSIFGMLAIIGAVALVITTMSSLKAEPEPKIEKAPEPSMVDVLTVEPRPMRISVASQGNVSSTRHIKLVSEVAGRVIAVADDYANGGFFPENMPLVTIDDRDYQVALIQAEAEIARAKELYAVEKGRARQAQREWRDLGNKEANALFLRKPQLEAAKSTVSAAEAARDQARLNVNRTKISAPFSGRIQNKLVDVGQYVTPGTIIAEVYSTEAVLIRLPLTDAQVAKVALPLTATNETTQFPDVVISTVYGGKPYSWQGRIVRTEASLDLKSRVTYAVAEIQQPYSPSQEQFRPPLAVGMYVSAEILGVEMENLVKVPRKVIHKENQITLVDEQDEIRFKTIEIVQNSGSEAIVTGLSRGDRVLLTRVPYMVSGLKVKPNSETSIADVPVTDSSQNTVDEKAVN